LITSLRSSFNIITKREHVSSVSPPLTPHTSPSINEPTTTSPLSKKAKTTPKTPKSDEKKPKATINGSWAASKREAIMDRIVATGFQVLDVNALIAEVCRQTAIRSFWWADIHVWSQFWLSALQLKTNSRRQEG